VPPQYVFGYGSPTRYGPATIAENIATSNGTRYIAF
jgi:hypothetical protein